MHQGRLFTSGRTLFVLLAVSLSLISVRGQEALRNWHKILDLPGEQIVGLAAGPGKNGQTYVVAATWTGDIVSWPQNDPSTHLRVVNTPWNFNSVAWGNGRFVVSAGYSNPIMTSTNAVSWRSLAGVSLNKVVFGNGTFLGVGRNGLLRSADGLNWTAEPLPQTTYLPELHSPGRKFIITSLDGTNYLSSDGLAWTAEKSDELRNVYSIGFGEGTYVAMAIAREENVLVSSDAITWQPESRLDLLRPGGIAWGHGYFVTVGGGGRAYSSDGGSWTLAPSGVTEHKVIFSNGHFIACGYGGVHQSGEVVSLTLMPNGEIEVRGIPNERYQILWTDDLADSGDWTVRHTFEMPESSVHRWRASSGENLGGFYRASRIAAD